MDNPPAPTPENPLNQASPASPQQPTSDHETPLEPVRSRPYNSWRVLTTALSVAILVATLFTIWTPGVLLSKDLVDPIALLQPLLRSTQAGLPTPTVPARPRIGIVAGHSGPQNDPGAVCSDGLTEAKVNLTIATLVQKDLVEQGYDVDLLQEFDPRLTKYKASLLVSIHNDSCNYINDEATGFKVAAAQASLNPDKASRLTACLTDRYAKTTGLRFHYNSVTADMTRYHAFDEIDPNTTAAIIETGFLNLDRKILTEQPDLVAQGVTAGILCFLHNEDIPPTATPPAP
jgi:N-acetylmuramoyl-L-alanine amidase